MSIEATSTLIAGYQTEKIDREELALIPAPKGTRTHKPVPHIAIVEALIETLGFRHLSVIREEYAVSRDGMRLFGVLDLNTSFDGCRFSIGLRNSNDKSMRLGLTVGYRVLVCENMAFRGDFTPVLAKHSAHFDLIDVLSIGVDKIQRSFEPLRLQVEAWKSLQLSDTRAKQIIYEAFVEGKLEAPKTLISSVHDLYFNPRYEEFQQRTMWSLSNSFTSSFKELAPTNQFKATAALGDFLGRYS